MFKKMLVVCLVGLLTCGVAFASESECENDRCTKKATGNFSFKGDVDQNTGAGLTVGTTHTKKDMVYLDDGAMAFGEQSSKAGFKADSTKGRPFDSKWGVGGALTVGGTGFWGQNTSDTAWAAGVVGSVSVAGVKGQGICATSSLKGQGGMSTMAYKKKGSNYAGANSNGSYDYKASAGQNRLIAGAGVTGGGSYVTNTNNRGIVHVGAVSGQGVVSGAAIVPER